VNVALDAETLARLVGPCPEQPSCLELFADPATVLGDKQRWPKHICVPAAQASGEWWAVAPYGFTMVRLWPMPVGEMAVNAEQHQDALAQEVAQRAAATAPWVDEVWTWFVLQIPCEIPPTLEVFATAELVRDDAAQSQYFRLAPLRFRFTSGHEPQHWRREMKDAQRWMDLASRWWALFIGQRVAGRKVGSGARFRSVEEFEALVGATIRTLHRLGRSTAIDEVLSYWEEHDDPHRGLAVRTLQRWCRDAGYPRWDDFVAHILKDSSPTH
jgi:hypothetical protein